MRGFQLKNGQPNGSAGQRACLVVAYHFPPLAAAGTHRTRAMVRHLPGLGWKPIVLSVTPSPADPLDPSLLEGLPADLVCYRTAWTDVPAAVARLKRLITRAKERPVNAMSGGTAINGTRVKTGGWADWLSWWWHVPDSRLGWLPHGVAAGYRAIRKHRCQAIYSTSPYWTSQLIGLTLHRLTGLPWVADFRDPWRPNPFRQFPYAGHDSYDAWLERRVVRRANRIVCNTPAVRRKLAQRYPEHAEKFVAILNGIEPEDFTKLRPRRIALGDEFVITHTGDFYGKRRPDPILKALNVLTERNPELAARVRLQLVGPPACNGEALEKIAARAGLAGRVSVAGMVSQQEARERMAGSDALLLMGFLGPGSELQVPSKLYEYFAVGKPILALSETRTAITELLEETAQAGQWVAQTVICDPHDPVRIAEAIARMAAQQGTGTSRPIPENMTRPYQARQLAELLDAGRRRTKRPPHPALSPLGRVG